MKRCEQRAFLDYYYYSLFFSLCVCFWWGLRSAIHHTVMRVRILLPIRDLFLSKNFFVFLFVSQKTESSTKWEKSFLAAGLCEWWSDRFKQQPSNTISQLHIEKTYNKLCRKTIDPQKKYDEHDSGGGGNEPMETKKEADEWLKAKNINILTVVKTRESKKRTKTFKLPTQFSYYSLFGIFWRGEWISFLLSFVLGRYQEVVIEWTSQRSI